MVSMVNAKTKTIIDQNYKDTRTAMNWIYGANIALGALIGGVAFCFFFEND